MRWDYLYRYYNRYSNGGFKRMVNEGFSAENTFIPYTPTYTACGHSSIYTGSVPAINGIIGNDWYDPQLKRSVYCAEDTTVKTVGSDTRAGLMSPKIYLPQPLLMSFA
ncbi:alkaline phosphatase family protein [Pedobacter steynii]